MSSNKLPKHRRLMTYALLAFITTTTLTVGITPPASASQFEWTTETEEKWGGFTAPKINKFTDIPTVSLNTNFKPEQTTATEDRVYKRCITENTCTLGEFFSNTWNKGQKILFNIFNPNPDVNLNPDVRFLQKPITNTANTGQVKFSIKLPNQHPNDNPGNPYNMFRCVVYISQLPSTLDTSCTGLQWIEGQTQLPAYDYFYNWKNIGFGTVGILIKSCFDLCIVADSATIDNQGQLPPQFAPEPQPGYGTEPEPARRLKAIITCKAGNGTITSVTKYSDNYLHSQGKTSSIDLSCPSNTRIIKSEIYEEKNVNNQWVTSPTTNINNTPGLLAVAEYPASTVSSTNVDINCITGQDQCKLDIVKSSPNGAVSCFNNVPNCLDFKTEVTDKINNNTYNQNTSQYVCVYNQQVKSMSECKPIFGVVEANQNNIGNNTSANQKSIEDVKECAPGGLQVLNPYAFAVSLGCVLEALFIPKTNAFYEKVQQAYYTETPLPQITALLTGFVSPVSNAKSTLSSNYCQGLDITIPLEITAWDQTPGKSTTVFLFAACDGLLKKVSDLWLPLANSVVYFSGFILGLNIYLRAWGIKMLFKGGTGIKVTP